MCLMSVKLWAAAMACELSWYPQGGTDPPPEGAPLHFMLETAQM